MIEITRSRNTQWVRFEGNNIELLFLLPPNCCGVVDTEICYQREVKEEHHILSFYNKIQFTSINHNWPEGCAQRQYNDNDTIIKSCSIGLQDRLSSNSPVSIYWIGIASVRTWALCWLLALIRKFLAIASLRASSLANIRLLGIFDYLQRIRDKWHAYFRHWERSSWKKSVTGIAEKRNGRKYWNVIYNVLRPFWLRNSQTLRSCIMRRIYSCLLCTNDAERERERERKREREREERERETDEWRVAPGVISEGAWRGI